ncbi:hypothetical protein T05_3021 [Trichinella murrelli]|uniref:Uncharacterized protein n=1 Tax=Trichinella murrelli TaxID=144512 RepID=A0A0V0TEY4_9BILA|nr:hypothetical protein T05_3021 [Trichinella murrelli]
MKRRFGRILNDALVEAVFHASARSGQLRTQNASIRTVTVTVIRLLNIEQSKHTRSSQADLTIRQEFSEKITVTCLVDMGLRNHKKK